MAATNKSKAKNTAPVAPEVIKDKATLMKQITKANQKRSEKK